MHNDRAGDDAELRETSLSTSSWARGWERQHVLPLRLRDAQQIRCHRLGVGKGG